MSEETKKSSPFIFLIFTPKALPAFSSILLLDALPESELSEVDLLLRAAIVLLYFIFAFLSCERLLLLLELERLVTQLLSFPCFIDLSRTRSSLTILRPSSDNLVQLS